MEKKKKLNCIAYLSVNASIDRIDEKEEKQLKELKEYALANNINIISVKRKKQLGQSYINRHINEVIDEIKQGKADGLLVSRLDRIAISEYDAYDKARDIACAGGVLISVYDGNVRMRLRSFGGI